MKTLKNPFFLAACLLYFLHQFLERNGIKTFIFIDNWLDDILCIPVILTIILFIQRKFTYRKPDYTFSFLHIFFTIVYISVWFELVLPKLSPKYTADVFDVFAYALGGVIFHFFINLKEGNRRQKTGDRIRPIEDV